MADTIIASDIDPGHKIGDEVEKLRNEINKAAISNNDEKLFDELCKRAAELKKEHAYLKFPRLLSNAEEEAADPDHLLYIEAYNFCHPFSYDFAYTIRLYKCLKKYNLVDMIGYEKHEFHQELVNCARKNFSLTEYLLSIGDLDINDCDIDILDIASYSGRDGNDESVKLFIKYKADPDLWKEALSGTEIGDADDDDPEFVNAKYYIKSAYDLGDPYTMEEFDQQCKKYNNEIDASIYKKLKEYWQEYSYPMTKSASHTN